MANLVAAPRRSGLALAATLSFLAIAGARPAAAEVDLQGVWKLAAPAVSLKPVDGAVPFTPAGRAAYDKNKALKARKDFDAYDIATSRCSLPGVPRLMLTPNRFKIWQKLNVVTFSFEWNRAIRQIDLRNIPKDPPDVPYMNGVATGRWEGDTLVSVTTNVSERTLIDDLVPHTSAMKVTERFRLTDPNTLEDRITIEDPAYFTRPWEAVLTYKRQPEVAFAEDICMDRREKGQPAFPAL